VSSFLTAHQHKIGHSVPKVKVKVRISLYGLETHHRATERHVPYWVKQCYLP